MSYLSDVAGVTALAIGAREGDGRKQETLSSYLRDVLIRRFVNAGLNTDEAQELAQDCLFEIITNLSRFDEERAHVSAWVSGFARTSLRSWRRKEYARRGAEISIDVAPDTAVVDEDLDSVDCAVKNCLGNLNLIDQELLHMRFSLGLSFEDIAEKSSLSVVNARKRLSRAVDKLRQDEALRDALGL